MSVVVHLFIRALYTISTILYRRHIKSLRHKGDLVDIYGKDTQVFLFTIVFVSRTASRFIPPEYKYAEGDLISFCSFLCVNECPDLKINLTFLYSLFMAAHTEVPSFCFHFLKVAKL
jgi:hypothetical protein